MGSASFAAARLPARPNRDDNTTPARRAEGLKTDAITRMFKDWEMKRENCLW